MMANTLTIKFIQFFEESRKNGTREKWSPGKMVPRKNGPRETWSSEKMVPGKMVPGKMDPRKNGPRKNGRRKIGPRKIGPRKIGPRGTQKRKIVRSASSIVVYVWNVGM